MQISRAVGPMQFGAGRAGGASLEVAEIRAAAQLRPNHALASLDLRNAFGTVERADALRARNWLHCLPCSGGHTYSTLAAGYRWPRLTRPIGIRELAAGRPRQASCILHCACSGAWEDWR